MAEDRPNNPEFVALMINSAQSDPRHFARGAGLIFQLVGLIFLLGGCCFGSLSGIIQGPTDVIPRNVVEWVTQAPAAQVIAAINTVVTAIAGLAFMVFGVGLANARRGSATGATITAGILAASWCATTVAAILVTTSPVSIGAVLRILANLLFALLAIGMLLLALAARREMRLHPPPPDEPVTPEFLAQFDVQRKLERELEDDNPADRGKP